MPKDLDVYKLRTKTNILEPSHPKEIDYWQYKWEHMETPLTLARSLPVWI